MNIIENTPWADNKNIADAYNDFMKLVPKDSWVLFRDADTMILDSHYGSFLNDIIKDNPNVSCFSAVTNRVGSPFLQTEDFYKGDDISIHRGVAEKLKNDHGTKCSEMPYIEGKSTLSGFFFLIKKDAWELIDGFKNYAGAKSLMLGVDNMLHKNLEELGLKTVRMNGFYVYHYYRGGNKSDISHLT